MKVEQYLAQVSAVLEYLHNDAIGCATEALEQLAGDLRMEIGFAANPKLTNTARRAAILRFYKECLKQSNRGVNGAFVLDGRQCLCNDVMAILLSAPIDGLKPAENPAGVPLTRLLPTGRDEYPLPTLCELRHAFRVAKAEYRPKNRKDRFVHLTELPSGYSINTAYLIQLMQMCGIEYGSYRQDEHTPGQRAPMIAVYAPDAIGLLCPYSRANDTTKA
jgi:hypothetical protein